MNDILPLIIHRELLNEAQSAFSILSDREAFVLNKRFGLDGTKPQTLRALGLTVKLSADRVRQIQNIGLAKLKSQLSKNERINV